MEIWYGGIVKRDLDSIDIILAAGTDGCISAVLHFRIAVSEFIGVAVE